MNVCLLFINLIFFYITQIRSWNIFYKSVASMTGKTMIWLVPHLVTMAYLRWSIERIGIKNGLDHDERLGQILSGKVMAVIGRFIWAVIKYLKEWRSPQMEHKLCVKDEHKEELQWIFPTPLITTTVCLYTKLLPRSFFWFVLPRFPCISHLHILLVSTKEMTYTITSLKSLRSSPR